ncbi:CIA30 family protein [Pelagibius sp.]|uniref:CIA30 family protein n=1 Tax=Pelagibius sp. TaxID=1931238 RepID=UPI002616B53B|nr:CIA30 family protein [Pelagibius sp.]
MTDLARRGLLLAGLACTASVVLASHSVAGARKGDDTVAPTRSFLIDDFSDPGLVSRLGTPWRAVSDRVMGGVSEASVTREAEGGSACLRLTGDVRLENNGGFVQAALDLTSSGETFDASAYAGLRLTVRGNGEHYGLHLRSADNTRPWQSYRSAFTAGSEATTLEIPFAAFQPYRSEKPLDVSRLRRLGLVAIGRAFTADLVLCRIAFYR